MLTGSAAPGADGTDGGPDAASERAADESPLPPGERVLRGIAVGLGGAIVMTLLGGLISIESLRRRGRRIGYVVSAC